MHLITDDIENQSKALNEGISCSNLQRLVIDNQKLFPELFDALGFDVQNLVLTGSISRKMHLSTNEISRSLKEGFIHKGVFRSNREQRSKSCVFVHDNFQEKRVIDIIGSSYIKFILSIPFYIVYNYFFSCICPLQ